MDEQELVTARASSSLPVRILRSHALSSPSSKSPGPLSASTRTHVPIQQISPRVGQRAGIARSGTMAGCAIFPWHAPGSQPLQSRRAARHPGMFEKYRTCDPCRFPQEPFTATKSRVFLVGNENCSKQHTEASRACSTRDVRLRRACP
jgi:hypothetical protein